MQHLPDMVWDDAFGTLVAKRDKKGVRARIDGAPLIAGIATILKQFHPGYTNDFVAMLSQYVVRIERSTLRRCGETTI